MNELMQGSSAENEQTMSSLEISKLTGKEHNDVKKDIRKMIEELELDLGTFSYVSKNHQNQEVTIYNLPKREALILCSGYSIKMRTVIIDRWQELENKKPRTHLKVPVNFREALLLAYEQQLLIENQQLQIENLDTVLDNLLDWVSIIKVAKFNKVSEQSFNWRFLKKESERLGYEIKKAESPRFGYQNLYHIDCFRSAYPQFNYNLK